MMSSVVGVAGGMRSSIVLGNEQFTAQALCQAKERMPLKILCEIYADLSVTLFDPVEGPRVLAVDGSKVPLGETMVAKPEPFPKYGSSEKRPHALISCIYNCGTGTAEHADVFNHHNEREAVISQLETGLAAKRGDILVFDRGYFSLDLAKYLQNKGLRYVFRVRKNANSMVRLCLSRDRLIHNSIGAGTWPGIAGLDQTRLVQFRKENSTFLLLTNLDSFTYPNTAVQNIYKR